MLQLVNHLRVATEKLSKIIKPPMLQTQHVISCFKAQLQKLQLPYLQRLEMKADIFNHLLLNFIFDDFTHLEIDANHLFVVH